MQRSLPPPPAPAHVWFCPRQEYPSQLSHEVPATLGPLVTVRDRKYGRTLVRVYGPAAIGGGGADDDSMLGF